MHTLGTQWVNIILQLAKKCGKDNKLMPSYTKGISMALHENNSRNQAFQKSI